MEKTITVIRYADGLRLANVNNHGYFSRQYVITDSSLARVERWAKVKQTSRKMVNNGLKKQLKIKTIYA